MMQPDTLIRLMQKHRVTIAALASACDLPRATVDRWRAGTADIPHWIGYTLQAVAAGLKPASLVQMNATDLKFLGVTQDRANFWYKTMQFPASARMAVAWKLHTPPREENPSPHDRKILDQVNRARYFRVRNGWRCRPTIGRPTPTMRTHTPDWLVHNGFLRISLDGPAPELKLTDKGRKVIYND